MDDLEVVLLETVLECLLARLDPHRVYGLHILVIEGAPLLLVLEQAVTMPLKRRDDPLAVQAPRTGGRIGPLVDDAVGRSGRTGGVGLVALVEVPDELLARSRAFQFRYAPGPGFGAQYAAHDVRACRFDHAQGQVGYRNLHFPVQTQIVRDPHGTYQVFPE